VLKKYRLILFRRLQLAALFIYHPRAMTRPATVQREILTKLFPKASPLLQMGELFIFIQELSR
jgi:hypothetical protein